MTEFTETHPPDDWHLTDARPLRELATRGQLANAALQGIVIFQRVYGAPERTESALVGAADQLVSACLLLLESSPKQWGIEVKKLLPFTELELELLAPDVSRVGLGVSQALVARLGEWVTRSPVFVDERSVHVVNLLDRLWPSLDSLNERRLAEQVAYRANSF